MMILVLLDQNNLPTTFWSRIYFTFQTQYRAILDGCMHNMLTPLLRTCQSFHSNRDMQGVSANNIPIIFLSNALFNWVKLFLSKITLPVRELPCP